MTAMIHASEVANFPSAQKRVLRPAEHSTSEALVSIVVPCFGNLEFTRLCVPRLLRLSRKPIQLILVDVGSLDGTAEYLEGLAAAVGTPAMSLRAEPELDLVGACQKGIEQAHGEFVALVSNDSLVTESWLNHLVALARLTPELGMVGCMSNLAPPPQWSGKLPYRIRSKGNTSALDVSPVDEFAREWRQKHLGQSFEVERIGGSCVLFKTEALRKIDLSGIPTPFGCIDGDLLSNKVRDAGYKLACSRDLFVHHFGTRLFLALRVDPATSEPQMNR
jgi:GT2 family glycosyltransferase